MLHDLKTWPGEFAAAKSGIKRHETRVFDRDYAVGDTLRLRDYDPETETYSGDVFDVRVTYITAPGSFGLPPNIGVMSIVPASEFR